MDYQWRENVVSVTGDIIDIKGAASNGMGSQIVPLGKSLQSYTRFSP